jgi:protein involved in temperature-dependent protein secretion
LRALAALEEGVGEDEEEEEEEEEEDATSVGGCIRSSSHGFLDRGPMVGVVSSVVCGTVLFWVRFSTFLFLKCLYRF